MINVNQDQITKAQAILVEMVSKKIEVAPMASPFESLRIKISDDFPKGFLLKIPIPENLKDSLSGKMVSLVVGDL